MTCKNCKTNPVITLTNSNVKLCKSCFVKYFERKVAKGIEKYKIIEKNDKISIACSGGKDSFTLLYLLNKYAEKKKSIEILVIAIDEGIHGYRDLKLLERYCKDNKLPLYVYSYKKEFGDSLDGILKKNPIRSCSICGVLRRFLLNSKARELGANKLATGHNLDDEAQSIIMNTFKGNLKRSAILGPITGIVKDKRFVRRIKPLYFMLEKEVKTYAFLKNFPVKFSECPYSNDAYRGEIRDYLNEIENKHPGTKHAIVNSFLDILPILKERFKNETINSCNICGEPCSGNICNVCKLLEKVNLKRKPTKT
ncbi:TIGR00269 family protein [Candidatus Woesearchaeota archaeon]|nr:TIGR00269 family protein [Candidatus Woesearchaeota archaeon]